MNDIAWQDFKETAATVGMRVRAFVTHRRARRGGASARDL